MSSSLVDSGVEYESGTSPTICRNDVVSFWSNFLAVVSEWDNAPEHKVQAIIVEGRLVRPITAAVETALMSVGEFVNTCEVSEDAWGAVLALDDFWESIAKWAGDIQRTPESSDPSGGRSVWQHLSLVNEALRLRSWKRVEPIQQLVAEKVPHPTIAKIYGWITETGVPDVVKVQEEIDKPGRHLNWATWKHPEQKIYESRIEKRWVERVEKFVDLKPGEVFNAKEYVQKQKKTSSVAPEPIEELALLPGITVKQIAAMKRMTEEEVRNVLVDLRIPLDHHIANDMRAGVTTRQAMHSVERENASILANVETFSGLEQKDERIWAMHDNGTSPGVIFMIMKQEHPGITYRRVVDCINAKPKVVVESAADSAKGKGKRQTAAASEAANDTDKDG